ncbi:MAG: FHA domain-containing protein [Planctomycetes bacterium]|nr:FHA domain-containing protein [Planctomycetota bacterium]
MNCEEITKHIFDFLSKSLPALEEAEFKTHIQTCLKCAERVIAEKELEESIKEKITADITLPSRLKEQIVEKISSGSSLKIIRKDGKEEAIKIKEDIITFGRKSKCTVCLQEDSKISRNHCRIERKGNTFEITDLDSRNGMYINGEKTIHKTLSPGDEIKIGDTIVIFTPPVTVPETNAGQKPAESAPAVMTTAKVEPSQPAPVGPAISPEHEIHHKHKKHRVINPREESLTPYLAAAAGILIAIGIIAFINSGGGGKAYNTGTPNERKSSPSAKTDAQITETQSRLDKAYYEVNNLAKDYLYKEALSKAEGFLQEYGRELTDSQKEYLKIKIEYLEQCLAREKETKESLEMLEKEIVWVTDPALIKGKYEELSRIAWSTVFTARINAKIAELNQTILEKEESEKSFAGFKSDITEDLAKGNYSDAVKRCEFFKTLNDNDYAETLIKQEMETINAEAKKGFEPVALEGNEILARNDLEKARGFYQNQAARFRGTNYAGQLEARLEEINKLIAKEDNQKSLARKSSLKLLDEGDILAKKYDYKNASAKYSEALKTIATEYPSLKERASTMHDCLKKESALFESLIQKIKDKTVSLPRLSGNGTVIQANHEGFSLSNNSTIKWASINPTEMYSLFKKTGLVSADPEPIAIFCLENKLLNEAFDAFNSIVKRDKALKPNLEELLELYTGKKTPEGGYLIYKNKWLTPAEKNDMVAQETLTALASSLKSTRTAADMGKICLDITKLIEANPSQKTELNRIILKDLQETYNALKKTTEKSFGKLDIEKLRKIKGELNQKRQEALKEIREGPTDPPASHPKTSQKMNEKVEAVRAIWEKPTDRVIQLDKSLTGTVDKLKILANEIKKYSPPSVENMEELDILSALTLNSKVDIKNFPLNAVEAKLIQYNKKVMEENEKNMEATTPETETVRLINEYRIMMGLQALKIHDLLTKAARKHSNHMQSVRQLAHEGIGDGTPASRTKTEGFNGSGVGENCYMSTSASPKESVDGWYWSHGHHINMIGNWIFIGPGCASNYYTTNFGR